MGEPQSVVQRLKSRKKINSSLAWLHQLHKPTASATTPNCSKSLVGSRELAEEIWQSHRAASAASTATTSTTSTATPMSTCSSAADLVGYVGRLRRVACSMVDPAAAKVSQKSSPPPSVGLRRTTTEAPSSPTSPAAPALKLQRTQAADLLPSKDLAYTLQRTVSSGDSALQDFCESPPESGLHRVPTDVSSASAATSWGVPSSRRRLQRSTNDDDTVVLDASYADPPSDMHRFNTFMQDTDGSAAPFEPKSLSAFLSDFPNAGGSICPLRPACDSAMRADRAEQGCCSPEPTAQCPPGCPCSQGHAPPSTAHIPIPYMPNANHLQSAAHQLNPCQNRCCVAGGPAAPARSTFDAVSSIWAVISMALRDARVFPALGWLVTMLYTQFAAAGLMASTRWMVPPQPQAFGQQAAQCARGKQRPARSNSDPETLRYSSPPMLRLAASGKAGSEGQLARMLSDSIGSEHWQLPWELAEEDIEFVTGPSGHKVKLGSGGFGEVCLARLRGVNLIAVKRLRTEHGSAVRQYEFMREVALLKELTNSNIVQFQGACFTPDQMLLVTEYMGGGDLFKAISKKTLRWGERGARVAEDVIKGLHFLHDRKIVHLDLKSPNILLSCHGVAKLADLGLARIMHDSHITLAPLNDTTLGTFAWAAPEMLSKGRCCQKTDMFSYGVVLWEIVTGEHPTRGRMRDVRVPEECPQEVSDLIDACMAEDPHARPSARQAYDTVHALVRSQYALKRGSSRSLERLP